MKTKTTMIQYFANIMTPGYKSTKIPLQVKSDFDAQMMTRAIADRTPDCIGYSTAVKVPGKSCSIFELQQIIVNKSQHFDIMKMSTKGANMMKNTKSTKSTTTLTANEKLAAELKKITADRKALQKKFKSDLQAVWDKYRADKKALREAKAAAWKKFKDTKAAAKKMTKKPVKKVTSKKVIKNETPKIKAADVIARGEKSIAKFKKIANDKITAEKTAA